jgi:hypothetical protein
MNLNKKQINQLIEFVASAQRLCSDNVEDIITTDDVITYLDGLEPKEI